MKLEIVDFNLGNISIIHNHIKEDYPILVMSWIRELSRIISKIKNVSLKLR